jgi:ribosomal protein L19
MKEILLTQGKIALVDDEDYCWLSQYKWHLRNGTNTSYATRHAWIKNKRVTIDMHRDILKLVPGDKKLTDHKDRNGLNNQKENLRTASVSMNIYNRIMNIKRGKTSKFRGVCWSTQRKKWKASITYRKQVKHLGFFNSQMEAALVYDNAAIKYYPDLAILNFPEEL